MLTSESWTEAKFFEFDESSQIDDVSEQWKIISKKHWKIKIILIKKQK